MLESCLSLTALPLLLFIAMIMRFNDTIVDAFFIHPTLLRSSKTDSIASSVITKEYNHCFHQHTTFIYCGTDCNNNEWSHLMHDKNDSSSSSFGNDDSSNNGNVENAHDDEETNHSLSHSSLKSNLNMEALSLEQFKRRKSRYMKQRREDEKIRRSRLPPNPSLSPTEFVTAILEELRRTRSIGSSEEAFGSLILLKASTLEWRRVMYQTVNVPFPSINTTTAVATNDNNDDNSKINSDKSSSIVSKDITIIDKQVAPILQHALGRPNNQYEILIHNNPKYVIEFPTDPLQYDFDDDNSMVDCHQNNTEIENDSERMKTVSTCWVECKLRDEQTNELMVIMGWSLVKKKQRMKQKQQRQIIKNNGYDQQINSSKNIQKLHNNNNDDDDSWLLAGLDWQDFRENYRPGIGREEWERICG